MSSEANEMSAKRMSKVQQISAWFIGAVVGQYSGIHLLFPVLGTAAAWLIASRFLSEEKKIIIPALSINAGHCFWLVIGALIGGQYDNVYADLMVYVVGMIWLIWKPSLGPLYILVIYQFFASLVNLDSFTDAAFRSVDSKALLVHIIWRGGATFCMVKLLLQLRKKATQLDL